VTSFRMKGLVVLSLFLSVAFGGISFNSNKNITVSTNDLMFRETQTEMVDVGGFDALYISSLSVTATNTSKTSDGLFGAAYATFGLPPTAYLAFYHSSSMWGTNPNGAMTADVSASDGFIGKSFLLLEEVDTNGTTVRTIPFDQLAWNAGDNKAGKGGLSYITVTANLRGGLVINVTFVVSDVSGILNVTGQPIVTPKSLESIVTISNYTYKAAGNSLKLTIGVGSGEANFQETGTFTSGSGTNQTYFSLQVVADIDGVTKTVNISGFVKGNSNNMNGNIAAQVNAKYGRAASFQLVSVSFPAGANTITYDPVIGSGSMYTDNGATDSNGASDTNGSNGSNGNGATTASQHSSASFSVMPAVLLFALLKLLL